MTATGHIRGHAVRWTGASWVTADGLPAPSHCAWCHLAPDPVVGADPCIGVVPGVVAACCGHGVEPPYAVWAGEVAS